MKYSARLFVIGFLTALILSTGCGNAPRTPEPGAKRQAPSTSNPSQPQQGAAASPLKPAPGSLPTGPASSLKQYPKVILGEKNWLYYGEPMTRLVEEGLLTDDQMKRAIDELVYISDSLKERGVHFLLLLVPDKQLVYPEFVPGKYADMVSAQSSAYERMSQALSAADIDFIDTRPILLKKRQETDLRLYYMRDNRWNPYGNLLITQEIMAQLGEEFPVPQYELVSVDTSETRTLTTEVGNDLNFMMQSILPWAEAGAPEPVYNVSNVSGGEQAPGILWYGDCFGAPMTDFLRESWPNTVNYVSLWGNYGFPKSFREDIERRLGGERVVILELDEHYRQELSRMLVPEPPQLDPTWTSLYEWQADAFLKRWTPLGEYDIEAAGDKVLITANDPSSPPSFYSTSPLTFTPSREYYLVINLTSTVSGGVLADFSRTTKGEFSVDWLRGQHIYQGDNTVIFKFPDDQGYLSSIKSLHIYLGDKTAPGTAGTFGISRVAIYSRRR